MSEVRLQKVLHSGVLVRQRKLTTQHNLMLKCYKGELCHLPFISCFQGIIGSRRRAQEEHGREKERREKKTL